MCGWIYDETLGAPDDGISPGTRWEDIPMIGLAHFVALVRKTLI